MRHSQFPLAATATRGWKIYDGFPEGVISFTLTLVADPSLHYLDLLNSKELPSDHEKALKVT